MTSFKEKLIDNPFEYSIPWLASIVTAALCVILLYFAISDKPFQGYYLDHTNDRGYCIYKNWRNWPDDRAFCTYDGDKALVILKKLKAMEKK